MRIVKVTGGTLFQVAALYLGDATQWDRIASLNNIDDPWLAGVVTLRIPDMLSVAGGGIGWSVT